MRRTDLTIQNATRVIITRANNWTPQSRLYSIEIRWDYEKAFAKYVWNNERYSLPSPVANKVVHIDTKIVAQTCAKLGLMFKSRFELNIDQDVYMEVWRKDLRDNKKEQSRLTLQETFKGKSFDPFTIEVSQDDKDNYQSDIFDEDIEDMDEDVMKAFSDVTVVKTSDVVVTKKSKETSLITNETQQDDECNLFD